MKKLSFVLNALVGLIILITPRSFHNDWTRLIDDVVLTATFLNTCVILYKPKQVVFYFIISALCLLYCLIMVNSYYSHESDEVNFYFRIIYIFQPMRVAESGFMYLMEELTVGLTLLVICLTLVYWIQSFRFKKVSKEITS